MRRMQRPILAIACVLCAVMAVMTGFVQPFARYRFRERVNELMGDPAELRRLMTIGAHKARAMAASTLDDVYQRVGFVPMDHG